MEKNYNKIDDFFKKAFEQDGTSDEGWNIPSEEVWEQLSETEPERKPVFLYWKRTAVAASLLLCFLVGLSIYHQNQLQQQAKKLEQLEQQIENQKSERVEKTTPNSDSVMDTAVENLISLPKLTNTIEKTEIIPTQSDFYTPKPSIQNIPEEQEAIVTNTKSTSSPIEPPLINEPVLLVKDEAIEALVSSTSLLTTIPPNLNVPKIIPEKSKTSYFTANYALVESAQTFDHRRIQNFRRSNVIQEENLNLGLRYTHFLNNNWFLEGGIHYSKSSAERHHLLQSRFQKNNESLGGNGNFESTHNLSLFSSAYDLETDVVLSRSSSSSTILDGINLRLVGIVTNEIQRLSVPVLVGHRLKHQNWNWTVKAGLSPTITLLDEVRLDRILSSETEFEVKAVTRTQRNPNTQPMSWYFYAGSSLSYQFNEAWAIQLEPYFSRSLSAQIGIRNSIFNHSTGIHLGLQYIL